MNIRRFAALVLLALVSGSCAPSGPELDTQTFRLQALSPHEAESLVAPYVYLDRPQAAGEMSVTEGALTVRETPDNLDKIARVLEEFDAPHPDVRLRFQLVEAGDFTAGDDRIADVEEELRRLFDFQGYRLAGEAVVTTTGGTEVTQSLAGATDRYEVSAWIARAAGGPIRLQDVRLVGPSGVGLSTTVNIRPGQTLVLGSSDTRSGETTLFLTVRAEVADG